MKKRKIFRFIIFTFLISIPKIYSQEPHVASEEYFTRNVEVPKSPEASALLRFGDNKVDMFSGTPEISVPVFSIAGRGSSIPYNLSYDASGVKVNQVATWTGTGWNLGGVGVISRINLGLPDDAYFVGTQHLDYEPHYVQRVKEWTNIYKDYSILPEGSYPADDIEKYFYYQERVLDGRFDVLPDLYSFSTPNGLSGKFFIDYENMKGKVIDNEKIKIIPTVVQNQNHKNLVKFEIYDEDGNYYKFDIIEYTKVQSNGVIPGSGDPDPVTTVQKYSSSFYLSQMILGEKKDVYGYEYFDPIEWDDQPLQIRSYAKNCLTSWGDGVYVSCDPLQQDVTPLSAFATIYTIGQIFPKKVFVNGVKQLEYITTSDRQDLNNNSQKLVSLRKYNLNQEIVQELVLSTSYFEANSNPNPEEMRLKLDSVSVNSNVNTVNSSFLKYKFDYNKLNGDFFLPSRYSKSQDYWGYFNDKPNSKLFPAKSIEISGQLYYLPGADRSSNFNEALLGTLKSIEYPTGGKTEYEYTLHNLGVEDEGSSFAWIELMNFDGGLIDGNPTLPNQELNPYEFYDDGCPGIIMGDHGSFDVQINNNNIHKYFQIVATNEGNQGTFNNNCFPLAAIVIYPATDMDFPTYQDFFHGDREYIYKKSSGSIAGEFSLEIPNGSYKYMILSNGISYSLQVKDYDSNSPEILEGGGLRIDKIYNKDANGDVLGYKRYFYDDFTNYPELSGEDFFDKTSGINQQPLNFEEVQQHEYYVLEPYEAVPDKRGRNVLTRFANNKTASSLGSNVTYGAVTELEYDQFNNLSKGFTVYRYTNDVTYLWNKPLIDFTNYSTNGKLLSISKYDSQRQLVEETINSYEELPIDYSLGHHIYTQIGSKESCLMHLAISGSNNRLLWINPPGVFGSQNPTLVPCMADEFVNPVFLLYPKVPSIQREYYESRFYRSRIINSETKQKAGNSWIENTANYSYNPNDDHYSVTEKRTTNSDGSLNVTKYKYVADIGSVDAASSQLLSENNLNKLISMEVLPSNTNAVKRVLEYDIEQGKVLPKSSSSFKNGIEGSKMLFQKYDAYGNVLQIR